MTKTNDKITPNEFLRWNITSDNYSWVIQRVTMGRRGKSKGEEIFSPVGYYATLEQACRDAVKRHVKQELNGVGIDITMGSVINQKMLNKVDDVLEKFILTVEK